MRNILFLFILLLMVVFCSKKRTEKLNLNQEKLHSFYNDFLKNKDLKSETTYKKIQSFEKIGNKNNSDEAMISTMKGIYFVRNASFDLAEHYLTKVTKNSAIQDSIRDLAFIGLGNIYKHRGKFPEALIHYQNSLKIATSRKDTIRISGAFSAIAQLNSEKGDAKESKKNIEKVFQLLKNKKHENAYLIAAHTLANNEGMNGNFAAALKIDEEGLRICDSIKNEEAKVTFQDNIARCYMGMNQLDSAQIYFEKNLRIDKKFGRINWIADSYINLAEVSMMKNNFPDAEEYLQQSIAILNKTTYVKNTLKAYEVLAKIYEKQGKFQKAYETKILYSQLYEKTMNEKNQTSFNEFNIIYETENKEKQIVEQKSKLFKRNVAVLSLLGVLCMGLVYYRNYKNHQKIKLQKEILHQQDLATKAIMDAEDNERKRMATHLHDGVGQLLTAANMNVSVLEDYKKNETHFTKIIDKTKTILEEAIEDVRTLSHQIMPNMLIKNTLGNALRELIEKSNSPKLSISLKTENLRDDLDQNIQVVMYRIIQECINNTLKHAEAQKVEIAVVQDSQKIWASFTDDGKGFNPLKISSKNEGLGLENIRSRIEFLKGKINIESVETKGTLIEVEIPINTI